MATETTTDVVMPQMGVSVSEGTIVRWVKGVGERIEADETLLEISTDKVDTEIPSPGTGVVQEILVQEGETVAVGTRIAVIGPEGGAAAPASEERPPADAVQDEDEPAEPQETVAEAAAASDAAAGSETPQPAAAEPSASEASGHRPDDDHTFVSPVVARIAAEHGIDPASVPGTGRGGRVTKKDILAFVDQGANPTAPNAAPPPPAAPPPQAPPPAPPRPPAAAPAPAPPAQPVAAQPGEQLEPVSAMRRGIAHHMRTSLDTA